MTDYLDWQSELSAQAVFSAIAPVSYPEYWSDGLLYISTLLAEQGRVVVMFKPLGDGRESICLTPAPFNLGSKFSEYGGKPYWLFENQLFFINRADQCLYRQRLEPICASDPVRLTPSPGALETLMYADLVQISSSKLLAIVETAISDVDCDKHDDRENSSQISLIDLQDSNTAPKPLRSGSDFYSNLCFDPLHGCVAWVEWNHPNMPWDENQLWLADLNVDSADCQFVNSRQIDVGATASICQLIFANNGRLFFSADFADQANHASRNFWNIYMLDPASRESTVTPVTSGKEEFGYPHWQYGDDRIVQLNDTSLLSYSSTISGDQLYKIDSDTLQVEHLPNTGTGYQNLSADGAGHSVVIILSENNRPDLAVFNLKTQRFEALNRAAPPISAENTSTAQHLEFVGKEGARAYGYFYAPRNVAYKVNAKIPPPLMVMVHGGPTARCVGFFDIQKQFWTQRGFAVLDVNHRGSSGYGRAFRDDLYGHWGEKDTADIIAGIRHLIDQGKVDSERVCIRGKSAGGYAVLRALTQYPEQFHAGACYYGIGNLVTLAESTHKFEKHYTDRLIGETYSASSAAFTDSQFRTRSPIHDIKKLQCAMIVFQGSLDKVVPPMVAHEIIDVLKQRDVQHVYVEYADEGHGFRQVENNIDAYIKELEFYRTYL